MIKVIAVAGGLAAMLTCAGTAQAAEVPRQQLLAPSPSARLLLPGTRMVDVAPRLGGVRALPVAVDTALADARRTRDALPAGPAQSELGGVIATVEGLAARRQITATRTAPIVATLHRNTEFWRASQPPAPGSRITFPGSPVILEYRPGEGLQIQPQLNFARANAAWRACQNARDPVCTPLRAMLDAMLRLAAQHGTSLAWEHYFGLDSGPAPWTSGKVQATAVRALTRAYQLTGVRRYRAAAAGAAETP